ncbi:GroES-like protein [Violaceomyces palustris]|uniref:GroES-like protein n=1 Tax=Violaceomyces palustris TaxID=1673888 RepID=A0ACD0NV99_9BASI|nr:GroES-like protein [Violaceomyces palustris]
MPAPTTFKSAVVPEAGQKHVLVEKDLPEVRPRDLLIRVTATAINPVDWKVRDYKAPWLPGYPAVLGSDAAGVVEAVGSEVVGFKQGDRVFFQGIIGDYPSSTFQQYTRLPFDLAALTPESITDDEAAGISLATMAVAVGLYHSTGHDLKAPWSDKGSEVGKGKAIVILGGSSSVGQYAIQLARISGFSKIITNSSQTHEAHLLDLGATTVLDRSKATVQDFVSAIGDADLDLVYDSISGKSTQALAVSILQSLKGGNVITVMPPDEDAVKQAGSTSQPKVEIKGIMGKGSSPDIKPISVPLMANLGGEEGYIAKGLFKPNRPLVLPGGLAAIEDALEANKKGVSGVKVVIRPNDA